MKISTTDYVVIIKEPNKLFNAIKEYMESMDVMYPGWEYTWDSFAHYCIAHYQGELDGMTFTPDFSRPY